jgi:hypothetical protein
MTASVFALSLASIEVTAILIIGLIIGGISLWGRRDVSQFLREHPAIESDASLQAFKALVRRQMHGALVAMALGIVFAGLCVVVTMQLLLIGFLLVLAVAAPIFLMGYSSKKLETKARTLTCPDQRRQIEYSRVATAWTGKLFPDF